MSGRLFLVHVYHNVAECFNEKQTLELKNFGNVQYCAQRSFIVHSSNQSIYNNVNALNVTVAMGTLSLYKEGAK